MLDKYLPTIERIRAQGAIVLLKWDGERANNKCTVVITRRDYIWRQDSDDIDRTLAAAIADYEAHHRIK